MSTSGDAADLRETAFRWLSFARSDLAVARMSDGPEGVLPETLCFHAQQAAEKAVKAVLVSQGIEFPKTHDIASLRAQLPAGLAGDRRVLDAVVLTDYAVAARYPGEREPLGAEDVAAAGNLAAAVVAKAESALPPWSAPS